MAGLLLTKESEEMKLRSRSGRARWSRVIRVTSAALLLVSLVLLPVPALASSSTPWTCDGGPNYYCATVLYDAGSPATNVDRRFEGYIGSSTAVT